MCILPIGGYLLVMDKERIMLLTRKWWFQSCSNEELSELRKIGSEDFEAKFMNVTNKMAFILIEIKESMRVWTLNNDPLDMQNWKKTYKFVPNNFSPIKKEDSRYNLIHFNKHIPSPRFPLEIRVVVQELYGDKRSVIFIPLNFPILEEILERLSEEDFQFIRLIMIYCEFNRIIGTLNNARNTLRQIGIDPDNPNIFLPNCEETILSK